MACTNYYAILDELGGLSAIMLKLITGNDKPNINENSEVVVSTDLILKPYERSFLQQCALV